MTILGRGDLSPPRRRHRNRARAVTALLVVVVLAVVGYFGWRTMRGPGRRAATPPRSCVTPNPGPTPDAPSDVVVAVLNSTPRQGLAHQLADALRARGFRIGRVGNTTPVVAGAGQVRFGPGQQSAALAVAEQVPGAVMTPAPGAGVSLVLGSGFRSLAPAEAAAAARQRDLAAASASPPVCSSP